MDGDVATPATETPHKVSTSERYRRKIAAQAGIIQTQAVELDDLRKKPNRSERLKRRVAALHGEVDHLKALTETLLNHLEAAIRPGITDQDRIRYRCMIQDIRQELNEPETESSHRHAA